MSKMFQRNGKAKTLCDNPKNVKILPFLSTSFNITNDLRLKALKNSNSANKIVLNLIYGREDFGRVGFILKILNIINILRLYGMGKE